MPSICSYEQLTYNEVYVVLCVCNSVTTTTNTTQTTRNSVKYTKVPLLWYVISSKENFGRVAGSWVVLWPEECWQLEDQKHQVGHRHGCQKARGRPGHLFASQDTQAQHIPDNSQATDRRHKNAVADKHSPLKVIWASWHTRIGTVACITSCHCHFVCVKCWFGF